MIYPSTKGARRGRDTIESVVKEVAVEMAIPPMIVQLMDGCKTGVRGRHLLAMTVNKNRVATLIHHDRSTDGTESAGEECFRNRIRSEMCQLLILLHCKDPEAFAEP